MFLKIGSCNNFLKECRSVRIKNGIDRKWLLCHFRPMLCLIFFFQLQQMYPRVTDIELNFSRMPSPQWSSISISEKSRMTKKRRHIIGCNWRQRQLQPMDCVNRKCRWEEKIRHSIRWSIVTYYFRPTECLIFFFESQVVHTLLRYSVFLLMQNVLRQLRNVFFLWATGIIYIFPKYSNHPPPTPALSPPPPDY